MIKRSDIMGSAEKKMFWRKTIKHRMVEAFGKKCICCGQSFEDCCYDLHHLEPNQKDFTLSQLNYNSAKTWNKIRDELKKCCLVCSNCHRLIHNGFLPFPTESTFNEEYYEWELTNFKQVNEDLIPLDVEHFCPNCGQEKTPKADYCDSCYRKQVKRFEVSRDELKELIYTLPFTKVGEHFGVSDNAIRKRCKKFNLPTKKAEIKKYSREEWDKI